MIDYSHNSSDELDHMVGATIKGWQEVKIDWGHSFVLLETDKKFDYPNEGVIPQLSSSM